jgi:quercetin dioxygenase-like cupin family protein
MDLNADFSARAAVHAARLDWTHSPIRGVDRRMLDRIGGEVARATSIVRYAPRSRFSAHTHDGGEEFLVLEGVFEDEHGQFPAGSYMRNPPTTRHTPGSEPGCTIFVKLWQFDPADRTQLRVDTGALAFVPAGRAGVEFMPLFEDAHEQVRLERWAPGAAVDIAVPGGIEILVLRGSFEEGGERFERHSWLRLPAGTVLQAAAGQKGCRAWVKQGHLASVRHPAGPARS